MAEKFEIIQGTKEERYASLLSQLRAILAAESDPIANMANMSACLKETFGFWWVGFYRVMGEELVLGPFQGPLACTRIPKGKGVCGTAWAEEKTVVVPDVDLFPGHIACSSASRSEMVVPVFRNASDGSRQVIAVLDIDSEKTANFDQVDQKWLEAMVHLFV